MFFLVIEITKLDIKISFILSTCIVLVIYENIGLVIISETSLHADLLDLIEEFMARCPLLDGLFMNIAITHALPEHIGVLIVLEAVSQTESKVVDVVLVKMKFKWIAATTA